MLEDRGTISNKTRVASRLSKHSVRYREILGLKLVTVVKIISQLTGKEIVFLSNHTSNWGFRQILCVFVNVEMDWHSIGGLNRTWAIVLFRKVPYRFRRWLGQDDLQ